MTSRMFPFITKTWNPIGGECQIKCPYCWARAFAARYNMQKYFGPARLFPAELNQKFKETDFIFVSDMRDMFESQVPAELIIQVLEYIKKSPAQFLLLTKNPTRYLEFQLPSNCVAGATIENDEKTDRILAMSQLDHKKMVSIEPILDFDLERFCLQLAEIHPDFVAVGYDNYDNKLCEPSFSKTLHLIAMLEGAGIKVYKKTLRDRWQELGRVVAGRGQNFCTATFCENPTSTRKQP